MNKAMHKAMYVVALRELEGAPEERAGALARVLGLTLYETRARVRPPAPRVVASFETRDAAEVLVGSLAREGFEPLLLSPEDFAGAGEAAWVRGFARADGVWTFETRVGQAHRVPASDLRLLLSLSSTSTEHQTDTSTRRRIAPVRMLMTGGLMATKKTKTTTTSTSVETHASLRLYGWGQPCFVFTESELQYQGLGASMLPARTANWRLLERMLREDSPVFDGRLSKRAGQQQLLGPTLDPDRHLGIAATLLERCLGSS